MNSPEEAIASVSQRVERFVADQRTESAAWGPEGRSLVDAGAEAIGGGKRLRARFCLAGWRAVATARGGVPAVPAAAVDAAAALEVFHAAALVHDDLIDDSDTRRGRPSAHRRLEAAHRSAGWAGDAESFGRSAAILLGDLLVAWSDDLLESGLVDLPTAADVRRQYGVMRRDVTVGQFLDVAEESAYVSVDAAEHAERALRVASMKSARYSIEQPLLIGAAIAGADDTQRRALSDFGHPLGLAFQLRDDVLGVFGDAAVTGKPSGDDLREGKRTLLIAYARERLDGGALRSFDELIGDPTLDAGQIRMLQTTITETGALARVEERIAAWVGEADRALRGAPLGHTAVSELRDLAEAATVRAA